MAVAPVLGLIVLAVAVAVASQGERPAVNIETTVTRKSPWDEDSRQAAYSLYMDELERCAQCNGPRSECEDPDRPWYPQRHICWKTAANEVAYRRWENANAEAKPDPAGFLPTDGTRLWVATEDLTPDDDFI